MTQMVNYRDELHKDISMSFNVHDHLKNLDYEDLREVCDFDRSPFAVGCINLTGNVNIGTIIRTASLYGAEKVIIFGRKQFDKRGLVGADKYIDVEFVKCIEEGSMEINTTPILNYISCEDYKPILIEQGGIPLNHFDWKTECYNEKPILIFGNENRGIDNQIIQDFRETFLTMKMISIPQKGVLRSHNVAVSSGIVMYDMNMTMGWV